MSVGWVANRVNANDCDSLGNTCFVARNLQKRGKHRNRNYPPFFMNSKENEKWTNHSVYKFRNHCSLDQSNHPNQQSTNQLYSITMDDTSSDEAVSQFMAITGSADASQAQSYLEMSGNDIQTAISLFLEHQSAPSGGGGGSSSGGGGGGSMGMGGDDQNRIRAPDQTRRMRLLDFDDGDGNGSAGMAAMGAGLMDHPLLSAHVNAMMGGHMGGIPHPATRQRMNAFADENDMDISPDGTGANMASLRDVINRAAMDGDVDDEVEDVTHLHSNNNNGHNHGRGGSTNNSSRATRLSDMFAPPLHLIHSAGGFQGARNVAKDSRRWLLVNLQSDSDFACHALNRDVWRDELCENLVREGFIFWQSVSSPAPLIDPYIYCLVTCYTMNAHLHRI